MKWILRMKDDFHMLMIRRAYTLINIKKEGTALFFKWEKVILFLFFLNLLSCHNDPTSEAGKAKNKDVSGNILLDNGPITVCHYLFTQRAKLNNEHIILSDTVVLEISDSYSVYYNESSKYRESIYLEEISSVSADEVILLKDLSEFHEMTKGFSNEISLIDRKNIESELIYKNRNSDVISTLDVQRNQLYICNETIKPQSWIIIDESTEVMGYTCYKAETFFMGRKYIAWFAKNISENEGPWKLHGLPGLILKVGDCDDIFSLEAFSIECGVDKKTSLPDTTHAKCVNSGFMLEMKRRKQKEAMQSIYSNNTLYYGPLENKLVTHSLEN